MTRKNLIIIAALINGSLLLFLALTGIQRKSTPDRLEISSFEEGKQQLSKKAIEAPIVLKKEEVSAYPPPSSQQPYPNHSSVIPSSPSLAQNVDRRPFGEEEKKGGGVHSAIETVVIVEKGDVLEKIARSHGVQVDQLIAYNQLKTTRLQIGQKLRIPPLSRKELSKAPSSPPSEIASSVREHVVQEGENPWTIAKKHHIKVEDLLRWNHLTEQEAKKLRPGQVLQIK